MSTRLSVDLIAQDRIRIVIEMDAETFSNFMDLALQAEGAIRSADDAGRADKERPQ